jgi:hypothetical protein
MKKAILLLVCPLILFCASASEYKITDVMYSIDGSTRPYALEIAVTVDKNRVFSTEERLMSYINDFKDRLYNTRAFEDVSVDFTVDGPAEPDETSLYSVHLMVAVKDSAHLLIVPSYPSYNSNSGLNLKFKVKDMNFLGSLNAMSSNFSFAIEPDTETQKNDYIVGFAFSFDTPFKAGIFDTVWTNDHTLTYTFGDSSPEWNAKTGLKFALPFKRFSLDFEFYQSSVRDFDYTKYGDDTYFTEEGKFSVPIELQNIDDWGQITYTPYIDAEVNWDKDGINPKNEDLSSPITTIGQTISTSRVNWQNNFRTGASYSLTQSFGYNFQTEAYIPGISGEIKAYKSFTYFGLCTDIYAFAYLNSSENIGSRLRGVRDKQYFNDTTGNTDDYSCSTPAALVINFDIPIHLFSTDFTAARSFITTHMLQPLFHCSDDPFILRWTKIFDLDFQVSPFIDCALDYNKVTHTVFHFEDGFYTGGLEILLYPAKWSSVQFRISGGIDLGRYLFSKYINTAWRDTVSKYELSLGVGLQY